MLKRIILSLAVVFAACATINAQTTKEAVVMQVYQDGALKLVEGFRVCTEEKVKTWWIFRKKVEVERFVVFQRRIMPFGGVMMRAGSEEKEVKGVVWDWRVLN